MAARRRKRVKSLKDYRQRLIIEAKKRLSEGEEDITIRALAKAVGISPSGVYKLFISKDQLILEASRMLLEELKAELERMDDPIQMLKRLHRFSIDSSHALRFLMEKDPDMSITTMKQIVDTLAAKIGDRDMARMLARLVIMEGIMGGFSSDKMWVLVECGLKEVQSR
jgi:AcrR family transcriptional regulator